MTARSTPSPGAVLRRRAPIDVAHRDTPSPARFTTAVEHIDHLGEPFHGALVEAIGELRGRPCSIPARAVLVGWMLNALHEGHRGEVADAAACLHALTSD